MQESKLAHSPGRAWNLCQIQLELDATLRQPDTDREAAPGYDLDLGLATFESGPKPVGTKGRMEKEFHDFLVTFELTFCGNGKGYRDQLGVFSSGKLGGKCEAARTAVSAKTSLVGIIGFLDWESEARRITGPPGIVAAGNSSRLKLY